MSATAVTVHRSGAEVPAIRYETRLRVRYADTDQMQIVYNGKYLEYFEVGRTELLRACGMPYTSMEAAGVRLPLVEAHCRYHAPARYDDMLVISSEVQDFHSPRLRIEYRIFKADAHTQPIVTGHTVHAFQDVASGRPLRPFAPFVALLEGIIACNTSDNSIR